MAFHLLRKLLSYFFHGIRKWSDASAQEMSLTLENSRSSSSSSSRSSNIFSSSSREAAASGLRAAASPLKRVFLEQSGGRRIAGHLVRLWPSSMRKS
ncbi:hypothetical protein AWZ03_000666 [Drosophila navojoa]|uniref:Uncharacterized protein n=1 Tax=Drosophila navojoa TaxID=7232 RepID=A0A484BWP8_DRONA|nr:hypothetical protein AWZ03_000666 [Drosophila navojoa]